MQVYGPSHLHGPQSIAAPHSTRLSSPVERTTRTPISDEVQISAEARAVEQSQGMPAIRQDRINAIRAEIAAGTYETQDKLNMAVDRLLDEIG